MQNAEIRLVARPMVFRNCDSYQYVLCHLFFMAHVTRLINQMLSGLLGGGASVTDEREVIGCMQVGE